MRALEWFEKGKKIPIDFSKLVMYHCGPLVRDVGDKWELVAAGPTTSSRMEEFEEDFIKNFKIRMIIGKGEMGFKTANSMKKIGAVYCNFTGGAAVLAANKVKRIIKVEWLDLGMTEAIWIMDVENFGPLTITIDSYGENLQEKIIDSVKRNRIEIEKKFGF